ncbi:expressed unknown protein [Seminavis robusta]|uniref:Uncharacterized protein n=1 Tax=Seminavis robusta TaxID=568900 RepID=A0A9N8D616_9STRA|nr:expressed unknown protein [Seminavis robusta]|eukprot:Sro14_g010710.1 n/a (478) ;mRNA; f:122319-123752
MVSPATDTDNKKAKSKSEKDVDEAFQALLSSQRDILAQLNFNNSSSELEFTEGPDNLPIISPHASYSHYDPQYPSFEEDMGFPGESYQQTVGVGDDRFILDQITIGPGEVRGPEFFDATRPDMRMRRRSRETEQELMGRVAQRKKRRNDNMTSTFSTTPAPTFCDDMLPGPSELADLDESSSSLLLDDLDFPSIHSNTDPGMWKPRERAVTEDSCDETLNEEASTPEMDSKPAAAQDDMDIAEDKAEETISTDEQPSLKPCVSMDRDNGRPRPPRRSQRSLWKPRSRDSFTAGMSVADRRSMWKPRKRVSAASTGLNDSCASLQMEDLETPRRSVPRTVSSQSSQRSAMQVSLTDGDLDHDTACADDEADFKQSVSRTYSSDSAFSRGGTPTVKALSSALQQSIGSTKTIQEWDRQMGLKRSHSKTMRQSSKSRERLLAFFESDQDDLPVTTIGIPEGEQQFEDMDEVVPTGTVMEI